MPHPKLTQLCERLAEVHDVSKAMALMSWDQQCWMPPKGSTARAEQLATLAALTHRLFTAPEMGALLNDLQGMNLSGDEKCLVEETAYDYKRSCCLPEPFVREFTEAQSAGFEAWREARKANSFKAFRPALERIMDLSRRKAEYFGYEGSPYNALLESYERGVTADQVRAVFTPLAVRQKDLLARIIASPAAPDNSWIHRDWRADGCSAFGRTVLEAIGYDFERGRRDEAPHPFCMDLDIDDVRITTRHRPELLFSSLMAELHEAGHALYEMGLPREWRRTTLCSAPGLGIHESQSRLWENIVGRSRPFWHRFFPMLRDQFPVEMARVTAEDAYAAANDVQPSLIRVEADEVTYNLHVVIRFEIESALIEQKLSVADLPEAWNARYREYLGIDVPSDADGCMQDVHWSEGLIGYFPTYALGNLYSAQLWEKLEKDVPSVWQHVAAGDFSPILGWLRQHVHRVGRRRLGPQIVEDATGRPPDAEPYLRYLEKKYGELYSLGG
jgi:carboxypeptidase Taq